MLQRRKLYPLSENLDAEPEPPSTMLDLSSFPKFASTAIWVAKDERFTFDKRDYMLGIYTDPAPEIRIVKGRQTEGTQLILNWLLYNGLKYPNVTELYISDRDSHTSKFSNFRLRDRTLQISDVLKQYIPLNNHTATQLKYPNGSNLFMHSAWGEFVQARSVPADFLAVDERQDVDGTSIDVMRESFSHSKYKKILEVGTGDDEDTEWHKYWLEGDCREWTEVAPHQWAWVATKPENERVAHSYHLPQGLGPWISRDELELKQRRMTPRLYTTEVLGWWYKGARKPITTKEVRALFDYNKHLVAGDEVDHKLGPVFVGYDWGGGDSAFTVPMAWQLIDAKNEVFRVLNTKKITERDVDKQATIAKNWYNEYKPAQAVMDGGGGARQVQVMEQNFGLGCIKCYYTREPKMEADGVFKRLSMPVAIDYSKNQVTVNRTWAMDNIISLVQHPVPHEAIPAGIPRIQIPAASEQAVEFLIDHYTAIESKLVHTSTGDITIYEHDDTQPDDAMQASVYTYMAYLIWKYKPKFSMGVGKMGGGE